jgi:hypothetical protein
MPDETPRIIDWPYPDPGPGMTESTGADTWVYPGPGVEPPLISNDELTPDDVPGPNAGWGELSWFALSLNGYDEIGNDEVGALANQSVRYHQEHGRIDPGLDLTELRACLFFEQRRYRHFSHDPDEAAVPYIRALVEAIRASARA